MSTARLIIGIVSCVLSFPILFQSCAAGVLNTLTSNGESSGFAGILLIVCLLVGGIIGIVARKSYAACMTAACFYGFGGGFAFFNAGSFADLKIWSLVAVAFYLVFAITSIIEDERREKAKKAEREEGIKF